MKDSGYVLASFDKPNFTEAIKNLMEQAADGFILPNLQEGMKEIFQCVKRSPALFKAPQNLRAWLVQ